MSIHTEELREVSGFDKEIDQSALSMIFDNLQVFQYQYPERSTVRELVSNALDSVKERQIAQAILSGQAKEEDYYLRREEAVYKASNFNSGYYDLEYLSNEDYVSIDYYEGAESERDRIEIIDMGVGLGGDRLKGYFKIGYSSKRNTKFALGKFGIGAKSALSTGVDCYYVESRYNGLLTKWNVYSAKINSLVPKFNLEKGTPNVPLSFDGVEVYAEQHTDPMNSLIWYGDASRKPCNYTKIVIQVKKHKKQAYLDAVKSQLMYFNNVRLRLHTSEGMQEIPTKAQIVFENEQLVIAKNTIYNKPHIILNGVNYGLIDFKELELEDKHGNVGIKVPAEGVVVNPSRESVIWNDKTRETILKSFEDAVEAASSIVRDRLKTEDYWDWQRTLEQAKGRIYNTENDNDALGVLSRIIDVEKVDFSFNPDPRLGSWERALWGIEYLSYTLHTETEKKGKKTIRKTKLERSERSMVGSLDPDVAIVFLRDGDLRSHIRTIRYLLSLPDYKRVWVFRKNPQPLNLGNANPVELATLVPKDVNPRDLVFYTNWRDFEDFRKGKATKRFLKPGRELVDLAEIQESVFKHILSSKRTKILEEVVVPESFKFDLTQTEEEEVIEEEVEVVEKPVLTPEQLRKVEGRVFLRTPRFSDGFQLHSVEPNLLEMDSWENTYFCTQENQAQLRVAAALCINPYNDWVGKATFPTGNAPYVQGGDVRFGNYNAHPNHGNARVRIEGYEDMTDTEKARADNEMIRLRQQWNGYCPYYFTPSLDNTGYLETFRNVPLRLIVVSKDLQKKLPDNVRPIQEFFLSFTPNHEITMSNIIANWYLASIVKDTLDEAQNYTMSPYFDNSRIKTVAGELRSFVQKWGKVSLVRLLEDSDKKAIEQLETFMEKVLAFQQFVSLHHAEPELIAAESQQLFGNPRVKGAVAFDMEVYNLIAELKEYHQQAGFFLRAIDWGKVSEPVADVVRELSRFKGWDPWVFEPPIPINPPLEHSDTTVS